MNIPLLKCFESTLPNPPILSLTSWINLWCVLLLHLYDNHIMNFLKVILWRWCFSQKSLWKSKWWTGKPGTIFSVWALRCPAERASANSWDSRKSCIEHWEEVSWLQWAPWDLSDFDWWAEELIQLSVHAWGLVGVSRWDRQDFLQQVIPESDQ